MTSYKTRKCIILIVLMVLCCAFTFFAVNTSSVSADGAVPTVTTLQMLDGAGIRTGTAKEAEEAGFNNTNGIRFQAEISSQEYGELAKFGTVTAGTFIMPKNYLEYADLTKENCFTGANQKYTWEGKTALAGTTDGTVKILHVAGKPHKIEAKNVYRIQGSVVDMYDENLDREYIGISYLKVDNGTVSEYYFAETKEVNARSILTVSQNILVENDLEHLDTANGFVEKYLTYKGGSVTSTLKEEIYVNSSTGYSLDSTKTETVTLSSAEDFTKNLVNAPKKDGYLYVTAKQEADNVVARVGEEVTVKYYFDKKIDDAIIFDSSRVSGDEDIFTANGATSYGQGFQSHNYWSYHGALGILYNDYSSDNYNFELTNAKILPAPTNKISFVVKNNATKLHIGDHENKIIVFMADGTRAEGTWLPSSIANDVYEVTITLNKNVTDVKKIVFNGDDRHNGYEENPMYIDYIHAEYDIIALGLDNIEITEAGDKTLDLDIDSKIISTKLSDAEIENGLTLTVKELPNGTATPLTANAQGKYEITATEGTNYEIEYAVSVGSLSVSGNFFILGYINGWYESFEGTNGAVSSRAKLVSNSIDGSNALTTTSTSDSGYANYVYTEQIPNTNVYTTLCFWAYSASDYTPGGACIFVQGDICYYAENTTIKAGWNYYEIKIRNNGQMNKNIVSVGFAGWQIKPAGTVIIDRISLKP